MISEDALGLLGLGLRARTVAIGTGAVRDGLKRGGILVVVVAGDGSQRTSEKVERLARAKGVPVVTGPSAAELGRRAGRDDVQALGITDRTLAEVFLAKVTAGR
jgi:ribosomal protein L7Ae-like RNA K-turn-binding protein